MAFLELKEIYKSYYLGKEEFPVLKGIDLTFELGDFVSILGESGGGKTTLMNIIGGLDRAFEGEVIVDGRSLNHKDEKMMDAYRRETVGYIYQSYNLIRHLTVLDNVLISLEMTELSNKEREQKAKELLKRVGLEEQLGKYPNQLSGGQKQRVAIARALANDPKIIIADEPTGALDAQNTKELLAILNEIAAEGRLVIAVTHSQTVANAGTRIVHLGDGKITLDERIKENYGEKPIQRVKSRLLTIPSIFKTAAKHFKYNFWRNSLIILGTAIGLFSVILFSGLGNGISGYITSQITAVANPQSLTVTRYVESNEAEVASPRGMPTSTMDLPAFTQEQVDQIKALAHVEKVENSYTATNVNLSEGENQVTIPSISNWTSASNEESIKIGRAPKKGEIVIDQETVAKKLSEEHWEELIGQEVHVSYEKLNEENQMVSVAMDLTIVGIGGSSTGFSPVSGIDTTSMVEALENANVSTSPTTLNLKIDDLDNVKSVSEEINQMKEEGNPLYASSSVTSMVDLVQTYVNIATILLAAIAGISLVVSALMIIVTMYMSVSARTKEIGILRALGESKRDIQWLFISESIIMGLLSATFATLIAIGASYVTNYFLQKIAAYDFIQISSTHIVIAFAMALVISLLASLLPAHRAAKLNPIEALSAD